jgi:hypothetical protein
MHIEKIEEYAIDFTTQQKIHHLLQTSFGQFPEDRIFFETSTKFSFIGLG